MPLETCENTCFIHAKTKDIFGENDYFCWQSRPTGPLAIRELIPVHRLTVRHCALSKHAQYMRNCDLILNFAKLAVSAHRPDHHIRSNFKDKSNWANPGSQISLYGSSLIYVRTWDTTTSGFVTAIYTIQYPAIIHRHSVQNCNSMKKPLTNSYPLTKRVLLVKH